MNAPAHISISDALSEQLFTAQANHFRSEGGNDEAVMESRLLDAAIACGMAYDHDDLHGWVAATLRDILLSGSREDDLCDEDYGVARDECGQWEYV